MLELKTIEIMKLFGSTKGLIDKTKNGENIPSIEVVKVALVPCNLLNNQNLQRSEVYYFLLCLKFICLFVKC